MRTSESKADRRVFDIFKTKGGAGSLWTDKSEASWKLKKSGIDG